MMYISENQRKLRDTTLAPIELIELTYRAY